MVKKESITIIGPNTDIQGKIETESSVEIFGSIENEDKGRTITSGNSVAIGANGVVKGNIYAKNLVMIKGTVTGNVETEGIVILVSGCRLIGDIKSSSFVTEKGAIFNGSIRCTKVAEQ